MTADLLISLSFPENISSSDSSNGPGVLVLVSLGSGFVARDV